MSPTTRHNHRIHQLVDSLPLPAPFEITTFLDRIGTQIGQPVRLWRTVGAPDLPMGMLLRTQDAAYIIVARGTSPAHLRHVVAHEVAHLLLGHQGDRCAALTGVVSSIDDDERTAESFAYALSARVRGLALHAQRHPGAAHLRTAFGSRRHLRPSG